MNKFSEMYNFRAGSRNRHCGYLKSFKEVEMIKDLLFL